MPADGDSFTPDESGPVVLWSTSAIEGALAERERLLSIIDRAAMALESITQEDVDRAVDRSWRGGRSLLRSLVHARRILAEADPGDPETGERMGVGDA
jgi:hypothetical protein